jgi:hypothetical protein
MNAERVGGALQGCHLLGRLAGECPHGECLQVIQFGGPEQQVRDQ